LYLAIFFRAFLFSKRRNIMDEEARKARNEYMRLWRAKNKEKLKAIENRYWEKKSKNMEVCQHESNGRGTKRL
jgi:hypothetical protein